MCITASDSQAREESCEEAHQIVNAEATPCCRVPWLQIAARCWVPPIVWALGHLPNLFGQLSGRAIPAEPVHKRWRQRGRQGQGPLRQRTCPLALPGGTSGRLGRAATRPGPCGQRVRGTCQAMAAQHEISQV